MSSSLLVLACILSVALAVVVPANFAPFGTAVGDTQGSPNDDGSFGPIPFDFIFYGVLRTSLYVNNNGIISFNGGISSFTPQGMSAATFPAIAIYWGDVDTRGTGTGAVYYRSTIDPALVATWSAKVSSTFVGTRMFIATWDHVGYYSQHNNKLNTFQAVLIADAIGNSWVFLNYAGLQWTTGDASGGSNGLGGTPASVGFAAGDRQTYVQTQESLTPAVLNTRDGLYQVNGVTIVIPPSAPTPTPAPPTQTCGNGVVEGSESCDGGNCCSSTCTFSVATTTCRASTGDCDVAETCTGASSVCPADSFQSASTVCRASAGSCDVAETCTGVSSVCPADSFQSASVVCRASAGSCDVQETCTGSSASCPVDSFRAASTVCRAAVNNCDVKEICSGTTSSCPADALSMTGPCWCGRQGITEPKDFPDYFCTSANSSQFYMCVYGAYLPQSRLMTCGRGTGCGCPAGQECSCSATQSPCVVAGSTQVC